MGCLKLTYDFKKTDSDYLLNIAYSKASSDYYHFGSKMPGRSITASTFYRLGYQGQPEDEDMQSIGEYPKRNQLENEQTGFNNFELRLYDARIGGWLSPDPYSQHFSPYMAMSNNPLSFIDPDGGIDGHGDFYYDGSGSEIYGGYNDGSGWSEFNQRMRGGSGFGNPEGLSASFENYDASRTYRNSFENTTIRKEIKYVGSETVKKYTAYSLSRGWVDPIMQTNDYYVTEISIEKPSSSSLYEGADSRILLQGGLMSEYGQRALKDASKSLKSGWYKYTYGNTFWYGEAYGVNVGMKANTVPKSIIKATNYSRLATGVKIGGYGLGVYNASLIESQYNDGSINSTQRYAEHTSNTISTFGGVYGIVWGIGWEVGRFITNVPGYHENVRLPLQQSLGIVPKPYECVLCPQ